MSGISDHEVAERAGVDLAIVAKLTEVGALAPTEDVTFSTHAATGLDVRPTTKGSTWFDAG